MRLGRSSYVVMCWMFLALGYPTTRIFAQSTATSATAGGALFRLYCASCHGTSGKGDGPLAGSMKVQPSDLTEIAKRNGGMFPSEQVAQIIDGLKPVKGHGGGDMPVWGDAFSKSSDPTPVAERIGRLVKYLESIQAKP